MCPATTPLSAWGSIVLYCHYRLASVLDRHSAWIFSNATSACGCLLEWIAYSFTALLIEENIVFDAEEAGLAALADVLTAAGGDTLMALGAILAEDDGTRDLIKTIQGERKRGDFSSHPLSGADRKPVLGEDGNPLLMATLSPGGESLTTWFNQSGEDWKLLDYWSPTHNALDTEITVPTKVLEGAGGKFGESKLQFKMLFGGAGDGPWDAWVGYQSPDGDWLSVNIQYPFQLLWMGSDPYYQFAVGSWDWKTPDGGPLAGASATLGKYKVSFSPAAGGTAYGLDVTLSLADD